MSNATHNNDGNKTMKTIEVEGRNGTTYDATQLSNDLYIVGKYIVRVKDGRVTATISRATRHNINKLSI